MPRNSQGLYTLPTGNPVIPGTLIESGWANETMSDIGEAITQSLPRDGSAPMTGPLVLETNPPTQPRHAVSKSYADSLLTYATGLPIGTVIAYAGNAVISGFLLCNGQAVSRTDYAALFGTIGTIYGAGDGSNTFNLPNLQNEFIRGKGGSRTLGSKQSGMVGPHNHNLTDPGHAHGTTQTAHSHAVTTTPHNHTVTDPGHIHSFLGKMEAVGDGNDKTVSRNTGNSNTNSATTGISLASASPTGTAAAANANITVNSASSGITVATSSGSENVPQNTAMDFYIKAVQDASGPVYLSGVDTSDHEMISVDVSIPSSPVLVIHSNVPFGTVKLDQNGKVPLANSQSGIQTFLGLWDASLGQNPSEYNPFQVYANGDTFLIGVGGTIDLFDTSTELQTPTLVAVGDSIVYVSGSAEQPDGWYFIVATTAGTVASDIAFIPQGGITATNVQSALVEVQGNIPADASEVPFVPAGTIAATDVQTAIEELDSETQTALGLKQNAITAVTKTSVTGAANIPVGTQAQRPSSTEGLFRFNSDSEQFEGYNGNAWEQFIIGPPSGLMVRTDISGTFGALAFGGVDVARFYGDFLDFLISGVSLFKMNSQGNAAIGPATVSSAVRLLVQGETSDNTKFALAVRNSGGNNLFMVQNDGATTVRAPAGLGYGTGAGGTVTQSTSKTTAVTLNKPCGMITTAADALPAGAVATFSFNNTLMAIGDTLVFSHGFGATYSISADVGGGLASVSIKNTSASSASNSIAIKFTLIKGVAA